MQLTVFGASGRIGQLVVDLALERGYTVCAFVHSHNPFAEHERLSVIKGDIGDAKQVSAALQGSGAVISALGSWGTKDKDTLTVGMHSIIPAMGQQGISRLISLTGSGALWSADKPSLLDKLGHIFFGFIAPKILKDGEAHLKLLEASQLDWTCVRAPAMNNRGGSAYHLNAVLSSIVATVSRTSVARCMIDLVDSDEFNQQAPVIHRGN